MQIHELPTISGSIGSGGYFATDNGSQTTKIDYDALAQAIIEQYASSTLAGTAQSVKAALDGLDGNKLDLKAGTAITNGTDVNTLQTPGTYFCASASIAASLSNIPSQATAVGFRLDVARNGYNANNYLTQTLVGVRHGLSFEYVRGMSVQGTWGEWQKTPTRAEVDALNSKHWTITVPSSLITNITTMSDLLTAMNDHGAEDIPMGASIADVVLKGNSKCTLLLSRASATAIGATTSSYFTQITNKAIRYTEESWVQVNA